MIQAALDIYPKPYIEILNGDCRHIMQSFEPDCIDLTVTSPPYDNLRTYNNKLVWGWDVFTEIADQLYRITKKGGVVVWVVGDTTIKGSETGTSFKQALYFKDIGFNLHDTMIYNSDSRGSFGSNKAYWSEFEYMFVFVNGEIVKFNPIKDRYNKSGGRKVTGTHRQKDGTTVKSHGYGKVIGMYGKRTNVWRISGGRRHAGHPAPFPEQLAHDHIISWSNEGDTILDPMMGSGTTGKMAKQLNRNFIGIEKDPEYFGMAEKRINEAMNLKPWTETV